MRRSASGFASAVLPSALFVYGVFAVAREYADERAARRRAGSPTRTRDPRSNSRERTRVLPPPAPHPAVDLQRGVPNDPDTAGRTRARGSKRPRKKLAIALIALGVVVGAYAAMVVLSRDPLTDLYARWKQAQAEEALGATFSEFDEVLAPASSSSRESAYTDPDAYAEAESEAVARAARRMMAEVDLGQAIGRLSIPDLDVKAVFLHGTRWGPDLSRGPGHYAETALPGVGETSAIAAHRTTFGAWFRNIDDLRPGDRITLSLPYGTFEYKVFMHKIVDDEDWSIIRNRGFDALVLSACHPLYSAKQRWVVFARLETVKPRGGEPYALTRDGEPVALDHTA